MYQSGGKLIGEGSYGCVYSPNLVCTKYPRNDNYVSKLINKKDIYSEFSIVNNFKLNVIDPLQKYLLYPLDNCNISDIDFKNDNGFVGCNLVKKPLDNLKNKNTYLDTINMNYTNIIMVKGGEPLNSIEINNIESLLPILIRISLAIYLLNINNICHRDLKLENILINDKDITRIIDFGISTYIDKFVYEFQGHKYIVWPIDYYILINKVDKQKAFEVFQNKQNEINLQNHKINLLKEFNEFYENYTNNYKSINELEKESLNKLDVYSFGIIITILLNKLLVNKDLNMNIYNDLRKVVYNTLLPDPFKRKPIKLICNELIRLGEKYGISDQLLSEFKMDFTSISTNYKIEDRSIPVSVIDEKIENIIDLLSSFSIYKLNVSELRKLCEKNKLSKNGTKDVLINRLYNKFNIPKPDMNNRDDAIKMYKICGRNVETSRLKILAKELKIPTSSRKNILCQKISSKLEEDPTHYARGRTPTTNKLDLTLCGPKLTLDKLKVLASKYKVKKSLRKRELCTELLEKINK